MYKAFDTLSWDFLEKVLMAKGFPLNWIQCIRGGVLTGVSRVLINLVTGKKIILRRGLRQGDSLLPYLFILAMDFLSVWTEKLASIGLLHTPFTQCKPCLLFADDTLFIITPKRQQLQFLKIILHILGSYLGSR